MKKTLLISALAALCSVQAQDCSDLFFSEYVEGSGQNKALEVYNPTNAAVDLSQYVIKRYKNGQNIPDTELILSGTLASKDVVVITNGQIVENDFGSVDSTLYFDYADIHGTGNHSNSPMYFNGNDALTLETVSGDIIDIFGKVGEDPDNGWNNIDSMNYVAGTSFWTAWTKDHTMLRKSSVLKGVTANPQYFNTGLEYDTLAENTFTELGAHDCECNNISVDSYNQIEASAYAQAGLLVIQSEENLRSITLINALGQTVVYSKAGGSNHQLDCKTLPNGVYTVFIRAENGTKTIKISL
ncbi:MAG: lamin tail domain-containing protein [Flavobacteriales bacterium]